MRFKGTTEEGEVVEFQNYCKDSDYVIEYGSELGVHKGIWKYIKKDTLVCLEVESLERQLAEAMSMLDNVWYWEGCPDDYKKRIEQLKEKGNE